MRRLVLGAALAVSDHVTAVVDEAAARVDGSGSDPTGTSADAGRVVVPLDRGGADQAGADLNPRVRHVVIGAVTEAGERVADLVVGVTNVVGATVDRVGPLVAGSRSSTPPSPASSATSRLVRS